MNRTAPTVTDLAAAVSRDVGETNAEIEAATLMFENVLNFLHQRGAAGVETRGEGPLARVVHHGAGRTIMRSSHHAAIRNDGRHRPDTQV